MVLKQRRISLNATTVSALPTLNQADFPLFPNIPSGGTLVCFGTEWANMEKETAAGCVVNICLYANAWRPVSSGEVITALKKHPLAGPIMSGVANAFWTLVDEGFIEVVSYQEMTYYIPTPRLANIVLANQRNWRAL